MSVSRFSGRAYETPRLDELNESSPSGFGFSDEQPMQDANAFPERPISPDEAQEEYEWFMAQERERANIDAAANELEFTVHTAHLDPKQIMAGFDRLIDNLRDMRIENRPVAPQAVSL